MSNMDESYSCQKFLIASSSTFHVTINRQIQCVNTEGLLSASLFNST